MNFYLKAAFVSAVLKIISCCDVVSLTFPTGFRIGAGSSSYQIEGAWNVSDKAENMWDFYTHNHPELIPDQSNGDIAANSYYKYQEDVAWIKSLGLDFYRFSISWSRVLPKGFTNVISEDGIQYYKNLTAELVANRIEPVVTIYHWDHPQLIEEMGGWTNELIVDWFVDYARVIFEALGDSVKRWITINEPDVLCTYGYERLALGILAPGKELNDVGRYLCVHNVLKAHAKTYRMYDDEFRTTQQGEISIVHGLVAYPSANSSDTESAETAFQFTVGWVAHPIYFGDYPEIMKTRVALVSEYQGYPRSRLPVFTDEWITTINGTSDFFSFNHYQSQVVSPDPDEEFGIYNTDMGLLTYTDPSWPVVSSNLVVYPPGFSYLLRKIRDTYGNPPVWVMENGYPDTGEVNDYERISYFYEYIREMLIAVKRDGCNVKGYAIWSLLDSFEWHMGYTSRLGIVGVDFNDPDRTRYAKSSTSWWKSVLAARRLQSVPTNSASVQTRIPWNR